jgi:peroxiredoxin
VNKQTRTTLLILAITAIVAGIGLQQILNKPQQEAILDYQAGIIPLAPEPDFSVTGQRRPEFSLPDVSGRLRYISEWDGQVLVVNFWATWCPPCLKEVPELVEIQHRFASSGFEVIGIALQKPEELTEFMQAMGMNYTVLAGEEPVIVIAEKFGNNVGVLPYTAIIDRAGTIVFVRAGPITGEEIEAIITELL